jgi:hypothetical protein
VATYSTVLGLKLNQLSDPFELSDFTANWDILDASPGTFICTSVSRPSWGTAQAGRMIFMTDLKQLSYWTGTAWADLRDSVPTFAGGTYLSVTCNPGSTGTFTILTFTTPRPSAMAIFASATYNYPNNKNQDIYQTVTFDGTQQFLGYREQLRMSGNAADSGVEAGANAMSPAMIPSLSAGQHKIGMQVQVGSTYNTPITLIGVKVVAFIALYQNGNSL